MFTLFITIIELFINVKYPKYKCSPSTSTALLTLNSFEDGGGGGACTGASYPDSQRVVALSTG
jgi:hypothetical protein